MQPWFLAPIGHVDASMIRVDNLEKTELGVSLYHLSFIEQSCIVCN